MIPPELKNLETLVETHPEEAMKVVSKYLDDYPMHPYALFCAGYLMLQGSKYGMAYNFFKSALSAGFEARTEAYNNMGMCIDNSMPEESLHCFEMALKADPDNINALTNMAVSYLKLGKPDKVIGCCNQALRKNPDDLKARYNRGLGHLFNRDWKKGWRDFSVGLGLGQRRARDYDVPVWDGEPGKVVVYGEQGIGDEIMFASCIPDLQKTNEVVIDTEPRLAALFGRSFDCPAFGTRFELETPVIHEKPDYQIAIGDLPKHFRNKGSDFPGTPYLKPDPERVTQWQALLDKDPGRKIGLAWTGGIQVTGKRKRSFTAGTYSMLMNDRDTFISLEYLKPDLEGLPIKHWDRATAKGVDFDETVALISCLDLVITCCTTTVYIAGALGIPTYVLVPHNAYYRYHLTGDFPWYKSVRLIRQEKDEEWESVVSRIESKLNVHKAA